MSECTKLHGEQMNNIESARSNIAKHVRQYMIKEKIPFAEVAKRLDMGQSTAWRICFDQVTNPQLKNLIKIADALKITLTQLLETSPDEQQ